MVSTCTIHQMVLFSALVDPIALHKHVLVGGFKHLDYFPEYIRDVILPIFFRSPSFSRWFFIAPPTSIRLKLWMVK